MSEVNSQFKKLIIDYVTVDDQIKSLSEQVKNLKKLKTSHSKNIITFMNNSKINDKDINISDGKIKIVESKSLVSVNKQYIQNRLAAYFQNATDAQNATDFIFKDREFNKSTKLKRTRNKKT